MPFSSRVKYALPTFALFANSSCVSFASILNCLSLSIFLPCSNFRTSSVKINAVFAARVCYNAVMDIALTNSQTKTLIKCYRDSLKHNNKIDYMKYQFNDAFIYLINYTPYLIVRDDGSVFLTLSGKIAAEDYIFKRFPRRMAIASFAISVFAALITAGALIVSILALILG